MSLVLHRPAVCREHAVPPGHPENADRLTAILDALEASGLAGDCRHDETPRTASASDVARVHVAGHFEAVTASAPPTDFALVDGDTWISSGTPRAASAAAGAACAAVDDVLEGRARSAFCLVRPPGHHAEAGVAMGFCFLNSAAIAARRAQAVHGLERVAILDFDVHHGNGTAQIFADDPSVLVASSFQHPFYPDRFWGSGKPNIVETPLAAGSDSTAFRRAVEQDWLPALEAHRPQLVLVSAGFDGHREDPLGDLALVADDYRWVTTLIRDAARRFASGRVVSLLEGGYDLAALAESAHAHLQVLAEG